MKKLNPKKNKAARRVRHPLPSSLKSPERIALCKECLLRPRELGSRCKKCVESYHESTKSTNNSKE